LLVAPLVAAVVATAGAPAQADEPSVGTIRNAGTTAAVPGSYLVVLKDRGVAQVGAVAASLRARYGGTITHVYTAALSGYAVTMRERDAKRLALDPLVAFVQQDQRMRALDVQPDPRSWGLDRIDQREAALDERYHFSTSANNVNAYIIDTGIRTTHQDFGGRARHGRDTIDNDDDATDCNGHGTHVAGTVGGSNYGVAKGVTLWAVRVLACDGWGTTATVVAGVDWVTAHAVKPAVANMSLGGGPDSVLDQAVERSIASGVSYAIAAGNSNRDACSTSPASAPSALTVGATYRDDSRVAFSNFGPCLDLFAPGVDIISSWFESDTATRSGSGTSMAAPHVAGAAALYLAKNPAATPQQVRDHLVDAATLDKVTKPGPGSPNKLLFTDSGITPEPPAPGCGTKTNNSDVPIPDAGIAVGTANRVAGCSGKAPSALKVDVHVKHTAPRDLRITLVGPSGASYLLMQRGAADVDRTFTVNASEEDNDGIWQLKVQDGAEGDSGYLDSWSLHLRSAD
jgi:subtilisin family serine protease